jgi:molybdenum cofactor guanylyltransferase
MTAPRREATTGLVLAGGRGTRMGGVQKSLLPWGPPPGTLASHALARLAPQVGCLAINANAEMERHAALGVPVWPDTATDHPGPLAGWLAALRAMPAEQDWLLSVPCDTPHFPLDLAPRLMAALQGPGSPAIAIAATADGPQPVFALLHRSLARPLAQALAKPDGERSALRFARAHDAAVVLFDDAAAFADADSPEDLARLVKRAE